ncbi:TonB-dependent receptor [Prevotella sp. E13-17]|uniref:TonB-dependent receptor n=1 Tax=Prevotella sp. E13-17 TaxID=2913616 RepID=UPI00351D3576
MWLGKKTMLGILVGMAVCEVAEAQVGKDTIKLKEVQIVGKSQARRLHEQAYAVSVLDLKKQYMAAAPLNKLLNTVSSVRIREDGGLGSDYSFTMNGFSGNQVKFFMDGIPMDNFGSSFNLASISANMADRIEVYKGVLPVSLGSDALGGAVNIVTRANANYLDATYSIGSFGTHRVAVNGAYTNSNGFTVRTNAFYNYSENDYRVDAPIVDLNSGLTIGEQRVKRFNDRYHSMGLRLETGLVNKTWADYLLLGVIASENHKQIQTGATMDAVYGNVKQRSYSLIPSLRYKKTDLFMPGLDLTFYATYNMVKDRNTDTAAVRYNWLGEHVKSISRGEGYLTDATIRNREWQATANLNYVIDEHQTMTLNHVLTALRHKQDDPEYPDYPMNNVAQILTKNITGLGYQMRLGGWTANVFGKFYQMHSSTHKLFDQFLATERYEQVSADKHQFGYGAAATYFFLPGLQAKVSFEQAYRMPEAVELFGDGFLQKSNTDLRPESSRNLNAGLLFDRTLGEHHVAVEANYIYRYTKDFIYKGMSLTNNPTTSFDNVGKAITHGIETSVQYDYKRMAHAGFNLTYQDIKDRQKTEGTTNSYVNNGIAENLTYGQRMPNIPYFFLNGDLSWNFNNLFAKGNTLTVAYGCNYVYKYYLSFPGLGRPDSKKYIPTQWSHNASLTYLMSGGKYSVALECTNLTNEQLYDNYRLQKPGRAINMKFRVYLTKM